MRRLFDNRIEAVEERRFTEERQGGLAEGRRTVRVSDECGQATKGAWWMSRRDEAMKDVVGCDKPRGAAKRALILGSPNRET